MCQGSWELLDREVWRREGCCAAREISCVGMVMVSRVVAGIEKGVRRNVKGSWNFVLVFSRCGVKYVLLVFLVLDTRCKAKAITTLMTSLQ